MRILPHTRSCFVCGESNPIGLRLRFETDGRIVKSHFVPRAEHIGFKQTVHGGLIATVLDEIMVWACAVVTKRFAYCAELNVRFVHPLRPNEEVLAQAELAANRKGKIFEAKGELRQVGGLLLATATGKYLPVPLVNAAEMAEDFLGETGGIFETSEGQKS
jgi:acyl-coenzyme A thioesterase PaaI-like protein